MDLLSKHVEEVVEPCWNFAGRCKTYEDHLQNAILGLAGEAGEVADLVKKMLYHTEKDGWSEKFKHELGDVAFYFGKVLKLLDMSLEDVLKANREKLESRHPELGKVTKRFSGNFIK